MSEKDEYNELLKRARQIAKKKKVTLSKALLLIIAHESICVHFHIDSGFVLGAIKHVDSERKQ